MNNFLLEKILRPFFREEEYSFAVHNGKDLDYEITNVYFGKIDNGISYGWNVAIKWGDNQEDIEISLDELLVFMF